MSNARRRDEWIAGRIAAKYAFLCGETLTGAAPSDALYLRKLNGTDLEAFPHDAYRSVSVIRHPAPSGGPARVGWSSGGDTMQAAISHSGGIACASVGTTGVRSLDIEVPAPRVPEFYLHTFTRRERDWVATWRDAWGMQPEWLYTLLWSARECLLKTPQFTAMSIADMPRLEIKVAHGAEGLVRIYESESGSASFELLQASTLRGPFQLAVAGRRDLIVTAITGFN